MSLGFHEVLNMCLEHISNARCEANGGADYVLMRKGARAGGGSGPSRHLHIDRQMYNTSISKDWFDIEVLGDP